jgi:hypothetical protein
MDTPGARSSKEIIVKDTYITGKNETELKRAENCLLFINHCTNSVDSIIEHIANLDHISLGEEIRNLKAPLLSMGYSPLYSSAIALENELLNDIISYPRPNLEDFIKEVRLAVQNADEQLRGMRVSLI